jgi:predicted trehalose synthase
VRILKAHLLEEAASESGDELNNPPDWVMLLIRGIKQILAVE